MVMVIVMVNILFDFAQKNIWFSSCLLVLLFAHVKMFGGLSMDNGWVDFFLYS